MSLVQEFLSICSFVPPFSFLGFVAGFLDNKTEELTKRLPKDYEMVRIGLERRFFGGIVRLLEML